MNIDQFRKNLGMRVKIRPVALSRMPDARCYQVDDDWFIEQIDPVKKTVKLRNIATDHSRELGADNIREFRTPNFLLLRVQIILEGDHMHLEPLM